MCGRFTLSAPIEDIVEHFETVGDPPIVRPRYNIAPSSQVLTVAATHGHRELGYMRWGLLPPWYRSTSDGPLLINARSESVGSKRSFASAYAARRCLIPADGFYEWMAVPGRSRSRPVFLHHARGDLLAFAGIWEPWRSGDDELRTCAILTTEADPAIRPVHHRMPVLLKRAQWDRWLDPSRSGPTDIGEMIDEGSVASIRWHPVATTVNRAGADDATLIEEIDEDSIEGQGLLF